MGSSQYWSTVNGRNGPVDNDIDWPEAVDTLVSSVITASLENGEGAVGVFPGARVMALRVAVISAKYHCRSNIYRFDDIWNRGVFSIRPGGVNILYGGVRRGQRPVRVPRDAGYRRDLRGP